MTDQTPEARLAAALWEADKEDMDDRADLAAEGLYDDHAEHVLAADPTLVCPDPDAHEGVTFTVETLADALRGAYWDELTPNERQHVAAAIIKAAKKAHVSETRHNPAESATYETRRESDRAKAAHRAHTPPFATVRDEGRRP